MTEAGAILIVAKATLLLVLALAALRVARRAPAANRHRICVVALGVVALVPLTQFIATPLFAVHLSSIAARQGTTGATGSWPIPWDSMLAALWASGCAVVALRFGLGCVAVARLRRSADQQGPRSAVPILAADVSVPMLAGFLRPAILLPRQAESWPERQREAAIQHELAHLRRGDLWANLVGVVACAMYWFHPLAWIVARTLREEQENACDDAVIESGIDCADYARALVETARGAVGHPLVSCRMTGRMTEGSGVKQRVARMLIMHGGPRPKLEARVRRTVLALFIMAVAIAGAVGEQRVYSLADGVTQPVLVHKVVPEYTPEARRSKIQGSVWVWMVVDADGVPRDVMVESGINPGLDRSAVEAILQWRFRPGLRGGRPVAVAARTNIRFRLA